MLSFTGPCNCFARYNKRENVTSSYSSCCLIWRCKEESPQYLTCWTRLLAHWHRLLEPEAFVDGHYGWLCWRGHSWSLRLLQGVSASLASSAEAAAEKRGGNIHSSKGNKNLRAYIRRKEAKEEICINFVNHEICDNQVILNSSSIFDPQKIKHQSTLSTGCFSNLTISHK